jgi:hypothetical protein
LTHSSFVRCSVWSVCEEQRRAFTDEGEGDDSDSEGEGKGEEDTAAAQVETAARLSPPQHALVGAGAGRRDSVVSTGSSSSGRTDRDAGEGESLSGSEPDHHDADRRRAGQEDAEIVFMALSSMRSEILAQTANKQ